SGRDRVGPLRQIFLWFRAGLSGMSFLSFWMGGVVLALFILPATRWRHRHLPPMERAAACQRWLQKAYAALHWFMRVCGLLHFVPRSVDLTVPAGGFVMVANHPTLVDVCALGAAYGRVACVAKTPLYRAPFLGPILRWCAYLNGGSGDPF